jgi:hypothetical protein
MIWVSEVEPGATLVMRPGVGATRALGLLTAYFTNEQFDI